MMLSLGRQNRKVKNNRKNQSRKRRKNKRGMQLLDVSWQIVGMITIIVILMTFLAGQQSESVGQVNNSFFSQTFSETLASIGASHSG